MVFQGQFKALHIPSSHSYSRQPVETPKLHIFLLISVHNIQFPYNDLPDLSVLFYIVMLQSNHIN